MAKALTKRTLSLAAQKIALDTHRRLVARYDPSLGGGLFEFPGKREVVAAVSRPRRTLSDQQLDRYRLGRLPILGRRWRPCRFATADQLLTACPSQEDIDAIRGDFNIWFEGELIDEGVLVPWSCSSGGSESSLMLTMYNAFRLMRCIPFTQKFPWAPAYNNLYDWLKSIGLTYIGYIWAGPGEFSTGWNKRVHLIANHLADPMFRDVVNPSTGVGLIHHIGLIVHEARHAEINIGHNCPGGNDTNLAYMGAWAAQFHFFDLCANKTGNFFTDYQKGAMDGAAQMVLETRFCEGP